MNTVYFAEGRLWVGDIDLHCGSRIELESGAVLRIEMTDTDGWFAVDESNQRVAILGRRARVL